jgi:hypothetical protein
MNNSELVESRIAEIFGGRRRKASKKAYKRGGASGGSKGLSGGRRRRSKKMSKRGGASGGSRGSRGLSGGRRRRASKKMSKRGGASGGSRGLSGGRRRRASKKASKRGGASGGSPCGPKGLSGGRRRASKKASKKGSKKMRRGLNPKMAKYQELTKLVREHSTDKGVVAVSKVTKKVRDEAIKAHPNKDFMEQIDAAKALFKANPKKYL